MVDDLPELRFERVSDFYQWAEELAGRPDVKCGLGVSRSGAGRFTAADYKDLALTVIGVAASMPDVFRRDMFRQVAGFGSEEARASLATRIADILGAVPEASGKQRGQLCRLAGVAILTAKATVGRLKNRPTLEWYAFALGMKRQSLDDAGWRVLIREAEAMVMDVYDAGQRQFKAALEQRGLWESAVIKTAV